MVQTVKRQRAIPGNLLEAFFNENFQPSYLERNKNYADSNTPAVNVEENDKEFIISLAAPGLSKKDFHISVKEDTLTIESSKEHASEEEQNNFLRREFYYKAFSKSFTLPDNTQVDKIKASHKNGVLNISIAKEEVKIEKAKEIAVN